MIQNNKPKTEIKYCAVKTYPKHDCLDWRHEHWGNNKESSHIRCGVCNTITGFHYKSFWKRLKALFNFKAGSPIKIKGE